MWFLELVGLLFDGLWVCVGIGVFLGWVAVGFGLVWFGLGLFVCFGLDLGCLVILNLGLVYLLF